MQRSGRHNRTKPARPGRTRANEAGPASERRPTPSHARRAAEVEQYAPLVRKIASGIQRRLPGHVLRDDLVAAFTLDMSDEADAAGVPLLLGAVEPPASFEIFRQFNSHSPKISDLPSLIGPLPSMRAP